MVHGMADAIPGPSWLPWGVWEPLIALAMLEPRAEREKFVKMFCRATARPGRRTPEKCYQEAFEMWNTIGADGKHPPYLQIARKALS